MEGLAAQTQLDGAVATTDQAAIRLPSASPWLPTGGVFRLVQIPRQPADDADKRSDTFALLRQASLTAANARGSGGAVFVGWSRRAPSDPVTVVLGGFAHRMRPDGSVELAYPIGSLGQPSAVSDPFGDRERLTFWSTINVKDRPPAENTSPAAPDDRRRPSLQDALNAVWHRPFSFVVCAVPAAATEVDRLIKDAEIRTRAPTTRGAGHETDTAIARRRYLELLDVQTEGLWHVLLAAGAASEHEAVTLSALIASTAELADTNYRLEPNLRSERLDTVLADSWRERDRRISVPSNVLSRLARPPIHELSTVRAVAMPMFDQSAEFPGPVVLGDLIDTHDSRSGQMSVSLETLNRHTFVCGATGSGKSQTVRHLLERVSRLPRPLPWLVIEPAKAEYARMAGRLADLGNDGSVVQLRPGEVDAVAAGLNPLEPCPAPDDGPGFPLQTHLDMVRALFLAAFDAQEPFPQVLAAALTRTYQDFGWDLVTGRPRQGLHGASYPTLADLQRVAKLVVTDIGYGQDVANNVRGFVDVRLNSLRLGTPGRFLEGAHPISIAGLLSSRVVVELEDVGDDQDKAFLMGMLLIRIVEHLRLVHAREQEADSADEPPLRHLLVIEEAHRLLRRSETTAPADHAVELFAGLLAEIRAYGQGVVVVEQIPSKILPDVVKNTALKIVHRLPAADDRDAVGATMNLSEDQSAYVVGLTPGRAVVFTDGMDYPLLIQTPRHSPGRETAPGTRTGAPCTRSAFGCRVSDCVNGRSLCTVAQLHEAQLLPEQHLLQLWVETEVIRLVSALPPSQPDDGTLAELQHRYQHEPRRFICCLTQAVTAAVHARSAAVARYYDPATLATRVIDNILDQLEGRSRRTPPPEFAAGVFYRHQLICDLVSGQPRYDLFGISPPAPGVDQLTYILSSRPNGEIVALTETLLYGAGSGGLLEELAGIRRNQTGFLIRLEQLLHPFNGAQQILDRLRPTASP